jgi:hypothetical protein
MFDYVKLDPLETFNVEIYHWLKRAYRDNLIPGFSKAGIPTKYVALGEQNLFNQIFKDDSFTRYWAAGTKYISENNGRGAVFLGPNYTYQDVQLLAAGLALKFPRYKHFVVGKNAPLIQVEGSSLPSVISVDNLLTCKSKEDLLGMLPYFGEYYRTYFFLDMGDREFSKYDMDKLETTIRLIKSGGSAFVLYIEEVEVFKKRWGEAKGFLNFLFNEDRSGVRVFQ